MTKPSPRSPRRTYLAFASRAGKVRLVNARAFNTEGFSLIEMALALVIVGILLSLGLKGYQLLDTARLRAVAAQIQSLQSAVMLYQDRFHALPGDGPAIGGTTVSGNHNGLVEGDGFKASTEAGQFWTHLGQAGLFAVPPARSGDTLTFGQGLVAARTGGGWIVQHSPEQGLQGLWMILGDIPNTGETLPRPALRSDMAQTLDQQLDDGLPESGQLRASGTGCVNDHRYDLTTKEKVCRLFMQL